VVEGFPIFSEAGFRSAFLLSAAVALAGALAALAIPHGRREPRATDAAAAPEAPVATH
jgi:hypothetical protein